MKRTGHIGSRYHHICKCTKVPTNGQMYCIFFNDSLLTAFAACVCVGGEGGRHSFPPYINNIQWLDGQSESSSYSRVEPLAPCDGLSVLYLPTPDPARRPSITPSQDRQQVLICMVIVGSILNKDKSPPPTFSYLGIYLSMLPNYK